MRSIEDCPEQLRGVTGRVVLNAAADAVTLDCTEPDGEQWHVAISAAEAFRLAFEFRRCGKYTFMSWWPLWGSWTLSSDASGATLTFGEGSNARSMPINNSQAPLWADGLARMAKAAENMKRADSR